MLGLHRRIWGGDGAARKRHLQGRLTERRILSEMEPPAISVDRIAGLEQATQTETFGQAPHTVGLLGFYKASWEALKPGWLSKGRTFVCWLARYVRGTRAEALKCSGIATSLSSGPRASL